MKCEMIRVSLKNEDSFVNAAKSIKMKVGSEENVLRERD